MIANEIPTRYARASSLTDRQHSRLSAVRTKRVRLPQRGRMGLNKLANRLRIATLNVGSMTGKGRELADRCTKQKKNRYSMCAGDYMERIKSKIIG